MTSGHEKRVGSDFVEQKGEIMELEGDGVGRMRSAAEDVLHGGIEGVRNDNERVKYNLDQERLGIAGNLRKDRMS